MRFTPKGSLPERSAGSLPVCLYGKEHSDYLEWIGLSACGHAQAGWFAKGAAENPKGLEPPD
jgi:hypothetical protein